MHWNTWALGTVAVEQYLQVNHDSRKPLLEFHHKKRKMPIFLVHAAVQM
jgi:hypothetical protein